MNHDKRKSSGPAQSTRKDTAGSQAGLNILFPGTRAQREEASAEIRASLGEERFTELYEAGQKMMLKEAIQIAKEVVDF